MANIPSKPNSVSPMSSIEEKQKASPKPPTDYKSQILIGSVGAVLLVTVGILGYIVSLPKSTVTPKKVIGNILTNVLTTTELITTKKTKQLTEAPPAVKRKPCYFVNDTECNAKDFAFNFLTCLTSHGEYEMIEAVANRLKFGGQMKLLYAKLENLSLLKVANASKSDYLYVNISASGKVRLTAVLKSPFTGLYFLKMNLQDPQIGFAVFYSRIGLFNPAKHFKTFHTKKRRLKTNGTVALLKEDIKAAEASPTLGTLTSLYPRILGAALNDMASGTRDLLRNSKCLTVRAPK